LDSFLAKNIHKCNGRYTYHEGILDDNLRRIYESNLIEGHQRRRPISINMFDSDREFSHESREEFVKKANKVFSRNSASKRVQLAEAEASMLWMAWRGSDDYLFRHSGQVDGLQFSWQICFFKDIKHVLEESQSREEFRPITEEFSEPILASIVRQVHGYCVQRTQQSSGQGQKATTSSEAEVFVEKLVASLPERKRVEILSSMSLIQDGWTLVIRWPLKEASLLFPRAIELSRSRLVLQNYPKLIVAKAQPAENPSLTAARGYLRFAKQKDKQEGARKRRLGVLRWLSTQRD
jgi:hypothetical protein